MTSKPAQPVPIPASQRYVGFVAALLLLLIVSVVALGRLLQADPQDALRIDPFNVEARVAAVSAVLSDEKSDATELAGLEAEVRQAIIYDPVDARLRSLLGEIELRQGRAEQAQSQFLASLRISKTEQLALRRLIVSALEAGTTSKAVEYIDLLARRWPGQFRDIVAIIPPLLQDPAAYSQMVEALQTGPPWRGNLIGALARTEQGLPFANRLLLDLSTGQSGPMEGELQTVLNALAQSGDYEAARRLFLFTLPEDQWSRVGLVYNPSFDAGKTALLFDWQYRNTPAAYLTRSSATPDNGMTVRFLDKPAREIQLRQTLMLEPGRYRLKVEASAANLKLPRGVFWRLRCGKPSKEMARLDVKDGTYRNQALTVEFDNAECAVQTLELISGLTIESWLYRYSGRVTFHDVSIERIDERG